MARSVLIGGEAGQGIARVSEVLGKMLVRTGYYVFNYRDYQSLIKDGHNYNVITFSEKPTHSHRWEGIEVLVALNDETISLHRQRLADGGKIICPEGMGTEECVKIPSGKILAEKGAEKIKENSVLLGALWRALGMREEDGREVVVKELGDTDAELFSAGYHSVDFPVAERFPERRERYFLTGNQAVALGAIAAGIDMYIAYPMTPATPVLHVLASKQTEYDYTVLQLENEIAVVNAALGASYAGAMTMVGTSGGGFALMTEALSLQGMSEVPLVVYLAQRNAPSTGIPTYTGQGDLKFALNAGHGEFPRVVVAPGDPKEAFEMTIEAFYLAYKYRVLSIIVSDKHLGESHYTVDGFSPKVKAERFITFPEGDYKSYEITDTGVSPRAVPGAVDTPVRATSYEHDEYGHTTEEGEWAVKMNQKRWRKVKYIEEEIRRFEPVKVYGSGKNTIVSWGSTKGAILDALEHLPDWKFVQVRYIAPFPKEEFLNAIAHSGRIVLVENNVTGLLGQVIAEQTGFVIEEKLLKYDARPFTPDEIVRGVEHGVQP